MKNHDVVVLFVALAVATAAAQSQPVPAAVALEETRKIEVVDGNLPAAIERYGQIADRYAKSDRGAAASALVRMARLQEILKRPEARATYARLERDYRDVPGAVRAVRERTGQTDVTPRRVLEGAYASIFDVSANGRLTVGPQRAGFRGFDVVVRDVTTGRSSVIVPSSAEGSSFHARLSDDGQRVAYQWSNTGATGYSLRIAAATPGATPIVARSSSDTAFIPMDWAPDGKSVLVHAREFKANETVAMSLLSVAADGSSARTLKTFEPWQMLNNDARFSPDGASIAYTARPAAGSTDRYLYLLDVATGRETALVTTAGNRLDTAWMPDGRTLLFGDQIAGRSALLAVRIDGGRASGEPWVVHADLGGTLSTVTKDGTLYFSRVTGGGNYEYVLPRALTASDRPVVFEGMSGNFSPDGSSMALIRNRVLIIRALATGEERSFRRDGMTVVSPRWLHDGSGVIVVMNDDAGGRAVPTFYRVDLQSGEFRKLFERDAKGKIRTDVGALGRDNKTLYLGARASASAPVTSIVAVDITTGDEQTVVTIAGGLPQSQPGIVLSPDGTTLAVYGWVRPNDEARLFTVDVNGTGYREIVPSVRAGSVADTIRWSPDGQSLVFVAHDANRNWRVMRVPASGGTPVFDGVSYETLAPVLTDMRLFPGNFNNIDLHPDGTRIVTSTLTMGRHELWTLDNAMSVVSAR